MAKNRGIHPGIRPGRPTADYLAKVVTRITVAGAERVTGWLAALAVRGARVLIGDPGRTYLAHDRLDAVAEYRIPVTW